MYYDDVVMQGIVAVKRTNEYGLVAGGVRRDRICVF